MSLGRRIWFSVIVALAAALMFAWFMSIETDTGWYHLIGLGLAVVLLAVIWFRPGRKEEQPTKPPS